MPAFLDRPAGSLAAAFLVVVAWRIVTTLLALTRGFSAEGFVASVSFLVVAAVALLPFVVALRLRPRFGWTSGETHLVGLAAFAVLHAMLWLYDRSTIFGDPAFFDRFMVGLVGFAVLAAAASHAHNLQAEGRLHWPRSWVLRIGVGGAALAILIATVLPAAAHTPAFDVGTGSFAQPVHVPGSGSSWAILQRLDAGEVAFYARDFQRGEVIDAGAVLLATHRNVASPFRPAVAVVGPGLPASVEPLPVPLPSGWGGVVDTAWRERGFEGFSEVPILGRPHVQVAAPQTAPYIVLVWDRAAHPGQVWVALGHDEGVTFAAFHTFPAAYLALHAEFW